MFETDYKYYGPTWKKKKEKKKNPKKGLLSTPSSPYMRSLLALYTLFPRIEMN